MGISVALTPATTVVTVSKSMITNASFRTKKLPGEFSTPLIYTHVSLPHIMFRKSQPKAASLPLDYHLFVEYRQAADSNTPRKAHSLILMSNHTSRCFSSQHANIFFFAFRSRETIIQDSQKCNLTFSPFFHSSKKNVFPTHWNVLRFQITSQLASIFLLSRQCNEKYMKAKWKPFHPTSSSRQHLDKL